MTADLIDIELQLLVLRYGREKVLAALSRLVEQTPRELEQAIQTLGRRAPTNRRSGPKPSLTEDAASQCRDRPEIAEPLRALAIAFENRTFLPNLRDVQRFLDRSGVPPR